MTPDEVRVTLLANEGKRVRITWDDGVSQSVDIHSVDDEGVMHSGPDGIEPAHWWTRFDSISDVKADDHSK
jgi:hypothetical protein